MHTPNTGTLPLKNSIASLEIPESVLGCPGPGEMISELSLSSGNCSGEMASFRITVTSAPRRHSCWYRFQVNESKLSMRSTSSCLHRAGGSVDDDMPAEQGGIHSSHRRCSTYKRSQNYSLSQRANLFLILDHRLLLLRVVLRPASFVYSPRNYTCTLNSMKRILVERGTSFTRPLRRLPPRWSPPHQRKTVIMANASGPQLSERRLFTYNIFPVLIELPRPRPTETLIPWRRNAGIHVSTKGKPQVLRIHVLVNNLFVRFPGRHITRDSNELLAGMHVSTIGKPQVLRIHVLVNRLFVRFLAFAALLVVVGKVNYPQAGSKTFQAVHWNEAIRLGFSILCPMPYRTESGLARYFEPNISRSA